MFVKQNQSLSIYTALQKVHLSVITPRIIYYFGFRTLGAPFCDLVVLPAGCLASADIDKSFDINFCKLPIDNMQQFR